MLARDEAGKLHLLHRGKIGGGRTGISKKLFWDRYQGETRMVRDGGRETEMALVGALDTPDFVEAVAAFIYEVDRIKRIGRSV